jgi:hypothetical protein
LFPSDSHQGPVPGDSLRSPLRGRAEARSAAQSSPGRGANFKASGENLGLFCFRRTLTRDLSQVIRFAHPFGAALKRVLLHSRVQVAEPTSKPQVKIWGFFVSVGLPPGTLSQVIRLAHPFGAALKRVLLRSRVQVAEPTSKPQTSARALLCRR